MNIQQNRIAAEFSRPAGKPAAIGAWECDLASGNLTWTDGVFDLFGLQRGSNVQRSAILDLYEDGSRAEMDRLRSRAIRTGEAFSLDCRIRTAGNEKRWMRLVVGVDYRQGRPSRIFGSKQDVTAEKGLWTGLAALARSEPRTDPSLRRGFEERIGQALLDERLGRDALALVLFDVDDFQGMVAAFGRAGGDELLRSFGDRLARLFPDALASGRVGEDEFALLLRMPAGARHLASSLESARRLLCRPILRGQMVVDFTVSIGIAVLDAQRHRDHHAIFAAAEAALQVATLAGGDSLRFFDRPAAGLHPQTV